MAAPARWHGGTHEGSSPRSGPRAPRSRRPSPPRARRTAERRPAPLPDRTPACLPCRGFRPCAPHLTAGLGAAEGAGPGEQVVTGGTPCRQTSYGPGVELEGAGPPRREGGVEDVQRVERLHPVDEVLLAEPVQGPHGE